MTWTYADLKTAITALSPMPSGFQAIANAINGQTTTLTNQPVKWADAKRLARTASTGDWSRIVARSRQVPAVPPATATDSAILAAINAVESADADVIDPTNSAEWTAFQNGLSALQAAGDLASATVSAIQALTSVTGPKWVPAVTPGDVQTAEAQP